MAEPAKKDADRRDEDRADGALHRRRIREANERGEEPVSWEEAERRLATRAAAEDKQARKTRS